MPSGQVFNPFYLQGMKKLLLLLLFIICSLCLQAQNWKDPVVHGGFELDALPYLTGGYFIGGWVGKNHLRLRGLTASVNKPDWTTPKGFSNHHVTAYAVLADYFLKPGWEGWWIGAGPVYWNSTIQTNAKIQTARFANVLLNGSMGYNWKFLQHFYLSPWAGLSLRISGDKNTLVDNRPFTLPLFNPEASLKLGFIF